MNSVNKLRLALVAAGLVSGSALAADIECDVTPRTSVIADGQTLQLAATCRGGALAGIKLMMNGTTDVSGTVDMSAYGDGDAVHFTTPVGLAVNGATFEVAPSTPITAPDTFISSKAKVVVKSAAGSAAPVATSGYAADAVPAACGTANNTTVSSLPTGTAECATGSKPALVVSSPTSFSWSCISLTGGAEANCFATREGTTPPPAMINGSCGADNGGTFSVTPTNLCATGTSLLGVTTTTNAYTWTCNGSNGGSNIGCSATHSTTAPPPPPPPPPPTGTASQVDTGYQSGLWVPPSNPNRTVADQSSSSMISSYVPGCLNGAYAKDSSSGCAGFDSFTGNTADTGVAHTVSLGSGKQLVLRYKTPSTLTNGKTIKVTGWNGGSVGVNMRIWLSTDALATYDNTSDICKSSGTVTPAITTGAVDSAVTTTYVFGKPKYTTTYYCKLDPNKVYYFGMEFNEAVSGLGGKFQVDELSADFLP
jgi:hypothetical protein